MKLMLLPNDASWWTWLVTVLLLAGGLAGNFSLFLAALALSALQTVYSRIKLRTWTALPVQIRLSYTALLLLCLAPGMHWLFWLPTLGTTALILFGYCLLARMLSLLPANRLEPMSLDLLRRTFFAPPARGKLNHGLGMESKPVSRCALEAQIASSGREQPA